MLSSRFYCGRQGGRREMALGRAGPAAYDWSHEAWVMSCVSTARSGGGPEWPVRPFWTRIRVACVGVTAVQWARLGKGKVDLGLCSEPEVAALACCPSGLHLSFSNSSCTVQPGLLAGGSQVWSVVKCSDKDNLGGESSGVLTSYAVCTLSRSRPALLHP